MSEKTPLSVVDAAPNGALQPLVGCMVLTCYHISPSRVKSLESQPNRNLPSVVL